MNGEGPPVGKRMATRSDEWSTAAGVTRRALRVTVEINKLTFDDVAKVRDLFRELTGGEVDDTFTLIPPFYSAYGPDLRVGHKVFINQCCTIYDMGGVAIGDRVMIGPNVSIITTSHAMAPSERRAFVETKPISIGNDVWIAAGVSIVGGVTIGENSVIGAGSVVTRNVPANSFAEGSPARVIRSLEES